MSVLWCGGEDGDFITNVLNVITTANSFRANIARCAIMGYAASGTSLNIVKANQFRGGAVNSAWLAFRVWGGSTNGNIITQSLAIGLAISSTTATGIYIGFTGSNAGASVQINKFDGVTLTTLATAPALQAVNFQNRYDLQISNAGANGTVNLYLNGALQVSYTGSIPAGVDCVGLGGWNGPGSAPFFFSEIIAADEPTLGWQGLSTGAPIGNGTTQQWQNSAYTNFNPISINDANSTYTDVVGQDQQATFTPVPAGNYQIKCVKVVARANGPAGALPTGIKLGFNSGTQVAVNPAHAINTEFLPYEDYFDNDPTTGQPWTSLTGYQLDMRSA